MIKNKDNIFYTVIVLTIISAGVALLLAIINSITAPVIAKAEYEEKSKAIVNIYSDFESFETTESEVKDADELYIVKHGSDTDYCVLVSPVGFGGEIKMMVGVSKDLKVTGVEIVTISETAGVGTKIKAPEFLSQYLGLKKENIPSGVDTISGATISSKASIAGVEAALDAVSGYLNSNNS